MPVSDMDKLGGNRAQRRAKQKEEKKAAKKATKSPVATPSSSKGRVKTLPPALQRIASSSASSFTSSAPVTPTQSTATPTTTSLDKIKETIALLEAQTAHLNGIVKLDSNGLIRFDDLRNMRTSRSAQSFVVEDLEIATSPTDQMTYETIEISKFNSDGEESDETVMEEIKSVDPAPKLVEVVEQQQQQPIVEAHACKVVEIASENNIKSEQSVAEAPLVIQVAASQTDSLETVEIVPAKVVATVKEAVYSVETVASEVENKVVVVEATAAILPAPKPLISFAAFNSQSYGNEALEYIKNECKEIAQSCVASDFWVQAPKEDQIVVAVQEIVVANPNPTEPVEQLVEQPVEQLVEQPVEQLVEQPVERFVAQETTAIATAVATVIIAEESRPEVAATVAPVVIESVKESAPESNKPVAVLEEEPVSEAVKEVAEVNVAGVQETVKETAPETVKDVVETSVASVQESAAEIVKEVTNVHVATVEEIATETTKEVVETNVATIEEAATTETIKEVDVASAKVSAAAITREVIQTNILGDVHVTNASVSAQEGAVIVIVPTVNISAKLNVEIKIIEEVSQTGLALAPIALTIPLAQASNDATSYSKATIEYLTGLHKATGQILANTVLSTEVVATVQTVDNVETKALPVATENATEVPVIATETIIQTESIEAVLETPEPAEKSLEESNIVADIPKADVAPTVADVPKDDVVPTFVNVSKEDVAPTVADIPKDDVAPTAAEVETAIMDMGIGEGKATDTPSTLSNDTSSTHSTQSTVSTSHDEIQEVVEVSTPETKKDGSTATLVEAAALTEKKQEVVAVPVHEIVEAAVTPTNSYRPATPASIARSNSGEREKKSLGFLSRRISKLTNQDGPQQKSTSKEIKRASTIISSRPSTPTLQSAPTMPAVSKPASKLFGGLRHKDSSDSVPTIKSTPKKVETTAVSKAPDAKKDMKKEGKDKKWRIF